MPRATPQLIRSPAQVRALISPIRQEIVDALDSAGPSTIARLAQLLGKAPDALYFHVRQLLRAGLVIEHSRAKSGRHVAAVYALPHPAPALSYTDPVKPADLTRVINSALRLASRDFRKGLAARATSTGPRRQLWAGRAKGWISSEKLRHANALIAELMAIVRAGPPARGSHPVSFTFVLAPAPPSRRSPTPHTTGAHT